MFSLQFFVCKKMHSKWGRKTLVLWMHLVHWNDISVEVLFWLNNAWSVSQKQKLHFTSEVTVSKVYRHVSFGVLCSVCWVLNAELITFLGRFVDFSIWTSHRISTSKKITQSIVVRRYVIKCINSTVKHAILSNVMSMDYQTTNTKNSKEKTSNITTIFCNDFIHRLLKKKKKNDSQFMQVSLTFLTNKLLTALVPFILFHD